MLSARQSQIFHFWLMTTRQPRFWRRLSSTSGKSVTCDDTEWIPGRSNSSRATNHQASRGSRASLEAATFQDSPVLGNLVLRPLPNADCIPTGTGVRGSDNATPRKAHELCKTYIKLKKQNSSSRALSHRGLLLSWFRMNGCRCVLKVPRSWSPRKVQWLRITSQQRPQAQGVLEGPLEPPKPHVRGGAPVFQTIELVAEASRDARLHL